MLNTTLCLLIQENNGQIDKVLLAMKKVRFGAGWWNGVGGKVGEDESIENAAIRETKEEIDVEIKSLDKVGEITFSFSDNKSNQLMHIYFVRHWLGEPTETEEMKPQWFNVADIPYDKMWPDDIYWLPKVLENKLIKGHFAFDQDHKMISGQADVVEKL